MKSIFLTAAAIFVIVGISQWDRRPRSPPYQGVAQVQSPSPAATTAKASPDQIATYVVYAEKCHAELPPTFILGSVLELESFPSEVAQAAYDKAMKDYYRGPSSWCYAFGIPIRRVVREFLAD